MRLLLHIPILHNEADMGTVGPALARITARLVGEDGWAKHCETVDRFWEGTAGYVRSFDPKGLKLYQDGLSADGDVGRKVVEEAARRGSQNYRLVVELLNGGAELMKTEEPYLLALEKENIDRVLSSHNSESSSAAYNKERERLLEARDKAIAGAINATLREGDVGILFAGAAHDVTHHLDRDIEVKEVRSRQIVRDYAAALSAGDRKKMEMLARELSPDLKH